MITTRAAEWVRRAALSGIIAAAAAPAFATSITLNHEPIGAMPQDACIERARAALRAAGLSLLNAASNVAFAETGSYIVAIYCVPQQSTIVVTAAGPEVSQTDPLVTRVLDAWRGGARAPAPAPAPAPGK